MIATTTLTPRGIKPATRSPGWTPSRRKRLAKRLLLADRSRKLNRCSVPSFATVISATRSLSRWRSTMEWPSETFCSGFQSSALWTAAHPNEATASEYCSDGMRGFHLGRTAAGSQQVNVKALKHRLAPVIAELHVEAHQRLVPAGLSLNG